MRFLKYALLVSLFGACSSCGLAYDHLQDRERDNCKALPNLEEARACLDRNKTTYEQYEKSRQKEMSFKRKPIDAPVKD